MKKRPYRVLITGSRTWPTEGEPALALKKVLETLYHRLRRADPHTQPILIHGTAKGVDEMSGLFWLELGGDVEAHPADWEKYGRQAGFIRNKEMVDSGADICLAFIRNHSRGASQCVKVAERAGIEVKLIEWNDDVAEAHGHGPNDRG